MTAEGAAVRVARGKRRAPRDARGELGDSAPSWVAARVATPANGFAATLSLLTAPTATPGSAATAAATDNTVKQQSFLNAYSSHRTAATSVAVIRNSGQPTTTPKRAQRLTLAPQPAQHWKAPAGRERARPPGNVTRCRCTRHELTGPGPCRRRSPPSCCGTAEATEDCDRAQRVVRVSPSVSTRSRRVTASSRSMTKGIPAARRFSCMTELLEQGPPYAGWVKDANARGARLIAYDRPGYGASTPSPGRTIADAASDAAAIIDALGVQRFATWGVSSGGPHSLPCAALLRDRVTVARSIGGRAPDATRCNRTVPTPARLPKHFTSANGSHMVATVASNQRSGRHDDHGANHVRRNPTAHALIRPALLRHEHRGREADFPAVNESEARAI